LFSFLATFLRYESHFVIVQFVDVCNLGLIGNLGVGIGFL